MAFFKNLILKKLTYAIYLNIVILLYIYNYQK